MLEIGCNVVVLDLETYEELRKKAEQIDKLAEELEIRKSYDEDHIGVYLNGPTFQSMLQKQWDKSGLTDRFELKEDKSYWTMSNQYFVANLKPEPVMINLDEEPQEECEVEDNEPF